MGDNSRIIVVPWSDLPGELLQRIVNCLDTETDVLRFRAVCSSWRSSTTPFKKFPCSSLKLPFPFDAGESSDKHHGAYFRLVERTVYRVELPDSKEPNFWLVKIEQSADGKMRIINPISHRRVRILPETRLPKVLDTLDFRISEVCKAYALQYVNSSRHDENFDYKYAKKVVFSAENDEYVVLAIDKSNKLWYTKSGDEKWTMVRDYNACFSFYDVAKCKGQFHGIDGWGGTWAFDSIFESTRVCYNMYDRPLKRHLVELNNGKLFLVEQVRDKDLRHPTLYNIIDERMRRLHRTTVRDVDIIIYELDGKEKEWVETKGVNDWIIVVGDDCSYSVSTKEFGGCKGTRVFYPEWCVLIYTEDEEMHRNNNYLDVAAYNYTSSECYCSDCCEFSDVNTQFLGNLVGRDDVQLKFRGFHGENIGVCDYETGKTGSVLIFPEYADIFWPPPSWLNHS